MNLAALAEIFHWPRSAFSAAHLLTLRICSARFGAGASAHVKSDRRGRDPGSDIIVSTVPSGPNLKPFLDPGWVSPGAFVSAVDLGRSWLDGFEAFDRIVTDDRAQAIVQHAEGRVRYGGEYDTELAELITGARPRAKRAEERIVMIHPGNIVGDARHHGSDSRAARHRLNGGSVGERRLSDAEAR